MGPFEDPERARDGFDRREPVVVRLEPEAIA